MRKSIIVAMMVVSVLLIGANSFAGTMVISGTVTDSATGKGIAGAKLVWYMLGEIKTAYTNIYGKYSLTDHNWCDQKLVVVTKAGYWSTSKKVYDGSCCSCNPSCPPEYGYVGCRKAITVNFTMVKKLASEMGEVPLAIKPEIAADRTTMLFSLLGLFTLKFCMIDGNYCNYECLYQFAYDWANGPEVAFSHDIYDEPRPLPECPEGTNFADFVNDWLDSMFEFYYGDGE